jgi:MYXO-CTERM domain-containing protein
VYPAGRPFVRIYASIDPNDTIPGEIHENNNKGWNVVSPHAIPEPGPAALGAAVLATLFGITRRRRSRGGA